MHPFSFAHPSYDGNATGEQMAATQADALPPGVRRVIAHRAMMEIDADTRLVNLGIGMPEVLIAACFIMFMILRSM